MIAVLAAVTAALALLGVVQAVVAARLVGKFARTPSPPATADRPPVTVLKPLHGEEPMLEAALATLCGQDYPAFQIVFGVHDDNDPAAAVVRRLQQLFPAVDMVLVADRAQHGVNRKVGNLINMLPAARHDVLVIADSDVHARPDYLTRLVDALQGPNVGLATTLYAGLPAPPLRFAGRLGATQITHGFLPAAVLSRAVGRQDCLGATMCVRRSELARIGGFAALVEHLADDNVLGRRVAALGLRVALAATVPLTTVPESGLGALFRHELRWARTIRALEPAGFAASPIQYPLFWGLLTVALAGGALWSVGLFLLLWVLRAVAALQVDAALTPMWTGERGVSDEATLAFSCPIGLLPLRDILSVAVMLASYGGRRVVWRGYGLQADTPPSSVSLRPFEGTKSR